MYLHLGQEIVIRLCDIIGIFDIENSTVKKSSKDFLTTAQQQGKMCIRDRVQPVNRALRQLDPIISAPAEQKFIRNHLGIPPSCVCSPDR